MPINDWSDEIAIAELSDEPAFSEDVAALMRRFEGDGRPADVVLDLRAVTYLNSSNIAQLLRLRKKVTSAGRRMRICAVPDSVWGVMMVTGLEKIFEFTDDVATALASLQLGM
ncbi:MAG TPA: STAS domain-containing protein [Phycisphaerales bacterium]|nr:STAS domain-containing protein [Phycisphaerales bacterium]HMP37913.1 STAS domain-containing protein [Phycisphaerales bacterium]